MDKEEKLMAEVLAEAGVSGSPAIRKQKCTECGTIFETDDGRIKRCPACRENRQVEKEIAVNETSKRAALKEEIENWQELYEMQVKSNVSLINEKVALQDENKRQKETINCLIKVLNNLYGSDGK